jgi:hypothetical protein
MDMHAPLNRITRLEKGTLEGPATRHNTVNHCAALCEALGQLT